MDITQIEQLVSKGYAPNKCPQYKQAFQILFNKSAGSCNCNCSDVYNKIKAEIDNMTKGKLKNPNQTKESGTGKFQKILKDNPIKVEPVQVQAEVQSTVLDENDKVAFIFKCKEELIQGYYYPDRIKKAYEFITGNSDVNIQAMRRAIISYN